MKFRRVRVGPRGGSETTDYPFETPAPTGPSDASDPPTARASDTPPLSLGPRRDPQPLNVRHDGARLPSGLSFLQRKGEGQEKWGRCRTESIVSRKPRDAQQLLRGPGGRHGKKGVTLGHTGSLLRRRSLSAPPWSIRPVVCPGTGRRRFRPPSAPLLGGRDLKTIPEVSRGSSSRRGS